MEKYNLILLKISLMSVSYVTFIFVFEMLVTSFLAQNNFEPCAGFRTESDRPVILLESFTGWNPFRDDDTGLHKNCSVS